MGRFKRSAAAAEVLAWVSEQRISSLHKPINCFFHQPVPIECATLPSVLHSRGAPSTIHDLWHLQGETEQANSALFGQRRDFQQQRIILDDDIAMQQLEGRQGLAWQKRPLKWMGRRLGGGMIHCLVDGGIVQT